MDLLDHLERVRVRLAAAYRRLWQEGAITEQQLEAIMEVIDRIEHLPVDEVRRRLELIVGSGTGAGSHPATKLVSGADAAPGTPAGPPGEAP